ncbi:TetR family transcriptional regulator [Actinocorallia sp. API 0066]|uniref:TetR/AcrR family transcriptional regulator n=1 Tax=Actinocorallia sp. API 0066 TaxID=2896846 RepID=UPI001E58F32B|nr:TetR/AcrR family transcriptional regulator [Actinocorallia sp. API 0066]MCD0452890.1 TetR family transcriptional regulator [Actinocorallia sp. API 0066]
MGTDVRRRILAATLDLIGEHGISGLSNRLVAKNARVSLGAVTYHFSSQDELLSEALSIFVNDEIERLSGIISALEGTTLTLDEALALTRSAIEERPGRRAQIAQLDLYVHATRNSDLREAAARCYAAYDEAGTAMLKSLGVPEPERMAPVLGALIDGLELRRLSVDGLSVNLPEALAALIAGLRANSPT